MFRGSLRRLFPNTASTVSPLKLLGFNKDTLQKCTNSKTKHDLSGFLQNSLTAYPMNLILTNKTRAFSFHLKNIVDDINIIGSPAFEDPNDHPILIDYKVIDDTLNWPLHRTFIKNYACIPSLKNKKILILSFSKEGLYSNTAFLKSFKENYGNVFEPNACILNTHTYPFLREIQRSKQDGVSDNLYHIASLGLVGVNRMPDGGLVLVKQ